MKIHKADDKQPDARHKREGPGPGQAGQIVTGQNAGHRKRVWGRTGWTRGLSARSKRQQVKVISYWLTEALLSERGSGVKLDKSLLATKLTTENRVFPVTQNAD